MESETLVLVDLTFELKSGGSVLVPVRRFTRKAFQFEYLCCMPARQIIKTVSSHYQQRSYNMCIDSRKVAHFLEVQGVCCWKRTIPLGGPLGYRGYTRSLCCCHHRSLHTAAEP